MSSVAIVSSDEQLQRVRLDLGRSVRLHDRLPEYPFLSKDGYLYTFEFEVFWSSSFGDTLAALAQAYGDAYIVGIPVDPDIETFYWREHRTRAAFHIRASDISLSYEETLSYAPGGHLGGSLYLTACVVAVTGSTGKWAIWGERREGMALILVTDSNISWQSHGIPYWSLDEGLDELVRPHATKSPAFDAFKSRIKQNFAGLR